FLYVQRHANLNGLVELLDQERRDRAVSVLLQDHKTDRPRCLHEPPTHREAYRNGRDVADNLVTLHEQDARRWCLHFSVRCGTAGVTLRPHLPEEAIAGSLQLGLVQADRVAFRHARGFRHVPQPFTPYPSRICLIFRTSPISMTSSMSMLTLKACSRAVMRFTCPMESQPSTLWGDELSSMVSRSTPNTLDMTSSMVLISSF